MDGSMYLDWEGNPVLLEVMMAQDMVRFVLLDVDFGDGEGYVRTPCVHVFAGGQLNSPEYIYFIGIEEMLSFIFMFGNDLVHIAVFCWQFHIVLIFFSVWYRFLGIIFKTRLITMMLHTKLY